MKKSKEVSLDFRELKFLLFNKKKCRICGTKMKKITSEEYIGITRWGEYNTAREAYEVKFFYYCYKCDKKFLLEELVSKK
ncbi:hypothetical protein [Clostridium weizhouense]|uniref:Uncharacterized protein n=1 Tax=Clostridium weizhouense TaxID=2859781 RepID=A0ABS7ATE9_9CLOT|nr:hypothetical protein [Clostridium weizhouense]MBW6411937.1 hypothetical protein [Clostridium weizhouense]